MLRLTIAALLGLSGAVVSVPALPVHALASPTITSQATSVPIAVAGFISDTATLSGLAGATIPAVCINCLTFNVFAANDTTCTSLLAPLSVDVTGNGSYTQVFPTFAVGTFQWVVSYSGDANNAPAATLCSDQAGTSIVSKASPTIKTTATPRANLGSPISDNATLLGGFTPTGTIKFEVFALTDATCSSPLFTLFNTSVTNNGSYTPMTPLTPQGPGTYQWVATYSGDNNNNLAISPCNDANEVSTVKANPTITTLATGSANAGGPISDTATLLGGWTPTGTITFSLFGPSDAACTAALTTLTTTVSGSGIYTSADTPASAGPGIYHWAASYSGDDKNFGVTSACNAANESSLVGKASPTINTTATPATIGGTISDSATLVGGFSPTGNITFSLFGTADCSPAALLSSSTNPISATGSSVSNPYTPTAPGTYFWVATYIGDGNNSGVTSACNTAGESSLVSKASPTIKTTATPATIGGTISDTATLTGAFLPTTGNITFSLFGTADCAAAALLSSSTNPISATGSSVSNPYTPTAPGTYFWVAAYIGDGNNNGATSACNALGESSLVSKASPTIKTTATPATIGGTISDTATLTGAFLPTTGNITFSLFGTADCAAAALLSSSTNPISATGSSVSNPYTPTAPGTYFWVAAYIGDGNNNGATSACNALGESSVVSKASPTITSVATSATLGGTISDTATLALGVSPTGTITLSAYGPNNANCTLPAAFTSSNPVGNGNATSDSFTPVAPGTYLWVAAYSGDGNNNGITSACNAPGETSTVTQAANSQDVNLQMFRVGRFSSGHLGVFIVLISNTGTVDTSGTLTFTDTLPAGLTFVDSFSFGWNCSVAGQTVTCTFDNSLPVGGFTGLVLIVDVTAPRDTVLTNTGTVTPLDATPADNTASVTVTVRGGRGHEFEGNFEGNTGQNEEATLQE